MIEKPLQQVKDPEAVKVFQHIYLNAQGVIIGLSGIPTATAPLLKANEWGTYSNVLYHRVANTILVFTPSSTITVT